MNVVLWIVAGLLALVFAGAGLMKLTKSKAEIMANPAMGWAEDFSPGTIKFIGAVEVLGAIGLILPAATGILPILTPLAATGLAITMALAAAVHGRRAENQQVVMNIVLLALAAFVAIMRFGPQAL